MNFAYGVIAAVGILIALNLGLISVGLDEVIGPYDTQVADMPVAETAHMQATVSIGMGTGTPGCQVNYECFVPHTVSISAGGTVTWSNDDTVVHTVTSGTSDSGMDGLFDSELFRSNTTFEHTFEDVGQYDYYCIVHPWMEGIVLVA